jgi:predicted methyltransferase
MSTSNIRDSISRRTALAGLGAGGLGLALTAATRNASAQDAAADLAGHPNVGVWMVESPIGRAIAVYSPDGSVITALTASQAGPQGVVYASTQIGTWEPTGERGTHLTVVQLLSDGAGAYAGSVTVDAFQEVSEDGQTWMSGAGSTITIRDAADNVVQEIADGPPAMGVRMGPGAPGFPEGTPTAATPAA